MTSLIDLYDDLPTNEDTEQSKITQSFKDDNKYQQYKSMPDMQKSVSSHKMKLRCKSQLSILNTTRPNGSYITNKLKRMKNYKFELPASKNREWSVKEKKALKRGLEKMGDTKDYEGLAAYVISRDAEEIKRYIKARESYMMKHKQYYMTLFGVNEPPPPPAFKLWNSLIPEPPSDSEVHIKSLHEVLKVAAFEPLSVGEPKMDFSLIYNYLANLLTGVELPDISPLESALLWDTLSEVFNCMAVKNNEECLKVFHRLFLRASDSQPITNNDEVDLFLEANKSELIQQCPDNLYNHELNIHNESKFVNSMNELTGFSVDVALKGSRIQSACYEQLNPFHLSSSLLSYPVLMENSLNNKS